MPTYEYQCKTCGHHFEQFQRFSDDSLKECPKCGNEIRRVIYPTGVIFKGSGWYITDSRGGGSTGSSGKDGDKDSGKADGGKADAAKSESSTSDSGSSTEKAAAKSDD